MNRSEAVNELTSALVEAQKSFQPIPRTKEVIVKTSSGAYSFRYTPLDEIIKAVRPALAEQGLGFCQAVCGDFLETTLFHESGQWISDSMPLRATATAQAYGAELTYKRRYGFTSMIGIATEDDLDAKGADDEKPVKKSTKVTSDDYDSLPEAKQVEFKNEAKAIEADFYTKSVKTAVERYTKWKQGKEVEEQTALWFCMDSKVRSALKKYAEQQKAELERT